MVYCGCEQYNKPTDKDIRTKHTDSFSFNRNNYIEIYIEDYKENCNYQLKIKIVDFEDINQRIRRKRK